VDLRKPPVACITLSMHQPSLLQSGDDPGHRRWLHLLRAGELAQCERPTEDNDRECREARSGKPAGIIFLAELPQKMNGR